MSASSPAVDAARVMCCYLMIWWMIFPSRESGDGGIAMVGHVLEVVDRFDIDGVSFVDFYGSDNYHLARLLIYQNLTKKHLMKG